MSEVKDGVILLIAALKQPHVTNMEDARKYIEGELLPSDVPAREVYEVVKEREMTYSQAAAYFNVSKSTIGKKIQRYQKMLEQKLLEN